MENHTPRPPIQKEKLIAFIFAVVLVGFFLIDTNYWHNIIGHSLLILSLTVILLFFLFLLFYAGIIVIRSLVEASLGLSLLIFLSQAYCAPGVLRTANSDQALMILIGLGLLYVGYDFLYKVYKTIEGHKELFKKTGWGWQEKGSYLLAILFVVGFILLVYEVVNPIILGLCVYK